MNKIYKIYSKYLELFYTSNKESIEEDTEVNLQDIFESRRVFAYLISFILAARLRHVWLMNVNRHQTIVRNEHRHPTTSLPSKKYMNTIYVNMLYTSSTYRITHKKDLQAGKKNCGSLKIYAL